MLHLSFAVTSADCLSVVTYDSDVEVKFGLMQMAEANKTRAKSLVATIVQGSFTNLCGGLLKGRSGQNYNTLTATGVVI